MEIHKRLYLIFAAIFLVVLGGSTGYYVIFGGEPTFLDCVYMTVISLTTVGYGEVLKVTGDVPAQIFTIILITFGMGIILYGISTLTALIVEGQISGILRRRRMEKQISKLSSHYIVCGGGQTGRYVVEELIKNGERAVLIEQDEHRIELCKALGAVFHIQGDATDDDNLVSAGIKKAAGIVICLALDKDTLYVTMTARMLNAKIRIISRMVDPKIEPKLHKAGANRVVSPNFIGGLRMASELIRPVAVSFLDEMLRSKGGTLRIHEVSVSSSSQLLGETIKSSGLNDKFGILVLGLREHAAGEILFNPSPSVPLAEGATLVVMGELESIARVRGLA
jgi:voltage-gated potassium channel